MYGTVRVNALTFIVVNINLVNASGIKPYRFMIEFLSCPSVPSVLQFVDPLSTSIN